MKELIELRGLPGSGKSTWAKATMANDTDCIRINRDDIRLMMGGKYSKTKEEVVRAIRDAGIRKGLNLSYKVIVDDTNLIPDTQITLAAIAKEYVAKHTIKTFYDTPIEECILRDSKRERRVGEEVIRRMAKLLPKPVVVTPMNFCEVPDDTPKNSVIICDIDGTIADHKGIRSPFDESRVLSDRPRQNIMTAVRALASHERASIVFMSGRSDACETDTRYWLNQNFWGSYLATYDLWMRKYGDNRRDSIVKRELYEEHIYGKYKVIAIFDDRPQVIRECWQALGLTDRIFNVGSGKEF